MKSAGGGMRVAGKLFVIEGTDGSGKSTQFQLLRKALTEWGVRHRAITFPRYNEESSAPVRLYLSGRLGLHPDDVGPYAASSFFAIDRYISYRTDWMRDYLAGVPILCDRYTTSNAVHQAAKLSGRLGGMVSHALPYVSLTHSSLSSWLDKM